MSIASWSSVARVRRRAHHLAHLDRHVAAARRPGPGAAEARGRDRVGALRRSRRPRSSSRPGTPSPRGTGRRSPRARRPCRRARSAPARRGQALGRHQLAGLGQLLVNVDHELDVGLEVLRRPVGHRPSRRSPRGACIISMNFISSSPRSRAPHLALSSVSRSTPPFLDIDRQTSSRQGRAKNRPQRSAWPARARNCRLSMGCTASPDRDRQPSVICRRQLPATRPSSTTWCGIPWLRESRGCGTRSASTHRVTVAVGDQVLVVVRQQVVRARRPASFRGRRAATSTLPSATPSAASLHPQARPPDEVAQRGRAVAGEVAARQLGQRLVARQRRAPAARAPPAARR